MNFGKKTLLALCFGLISFISPASAEISEGGHRFSLSGGLMVLNEKATFAVSAEYEYRIAPLYGIGAQGSYVFATSAVAILAAPTFFLHPLEGNWYVSASPVFYFGSSTTLVGARFTTLMPLNIDVLTLIPMFGVDIIQGGPNYLFGLGIQI